MGSSQPTLHSHCLAGFSSPAQMLSQEAATTLTRENHPKKKQRNDYSDCNEIPFASLLFKFPYMHEGLEIHLCYWF